MAQEPRREDPSEEGGPSEEDGPTGATDALRRLRERADDARGHDGPDADGDHVTVGDLMDAFGGRSYGPFLLVPALIELSPLGGVPGVPTLLAFVIAVFAVQMLLGRDHFWLPSWIERRAVRIDRVDQADDKMRAVTERLDRWSSDRLAALTGKAAQRAAAVCTLLLCLTVPPLEFLPFASAAPMAAIAAFGLGLIVRDGFVMLAGFALTAVATGVGVWGGGRLLG